MTPKKESGLALRITLAWFLLFTLVSLCTSIVTVFYGMRWKEMDSQDRIMATILITANWGTVMMAFLNKAAHRVQQGQLPISEGDEDLLQTKTVVASTETKVMSPEKENP